MLTWEGVRLSAPSPPTQAQDFKTESLPESAFDFSVRATVAVDAKRDAIVRSRMGFVVVNVMHMVAEFAAKGTAVIVADADHALKGRAELSGVRLIRTATIPRRTIATLHSFAECLQIAHIRAISNGLSFAWPVQEGLLADGANQGNTFSLGQRNAMPGAELPTLSMRRKFHAAVHTKLFGGHTCVVVAAHGAKLTPTATDGTVMCLKFRTAVLTVTGTWINITRLIIARHRAELGIFIPVGKGNAASGTNMRRAIAPHIDMLASG